MPPPARRKTLTTTPSSRAPRTPALRLRQADGQHRLRPPLAQAGHARVRRLRAAGAARRDMTATRRTVGRQDSAEPPRLFRRPHRGQNGAVGRTSRQSPEVRGRREAARTGSLESRWLVISRTGALDSKPDLSDHSVREVLHEAIETARGRGVSLRSAGDPDPYRDRAGVRGAGRDQGRDVRADALPLHRRRRRSRSGRCSPWPACSSFALGHEREAGLALSAIVAALGVATILVPTVLIGTCGNPDDGVQRRDQAGARPARRGDPPAGRRWAPGRRGAVRRGTLGGSQLTAARLNLVTVIGHNIRRKPYRTAAIVSSVMLVIGTLFGVTLAMRSVQHSLQVGLERMGADIIVVPSGQQVSAQEAFIVGQADHVLHGRPRRAGDRRARPGVGRTSAQVFVQYADQRQLLHRRVLPRQLRSAQRLHHQSLAGDGAGGPRRSSRRRSSSEIASCCTSAMTCSFYGTVFQVVGKLAPTGMGLDSTVFVPIAGLRQMIAASPDRAERALTIAPSQVSTVQVKAQPGADPEAGRGGYRAAGQRRDRHHDVADDAGREQAVRRLALRGRSP